MFNYRLEPHERFVDNIEHKPHAGDIFSLAKDAEKVQRLILQFADAKNDEELLDCSTALFSAMVDLCENSREVIFVEK